MRKYVGTVLVASVLWIACGSDIELSPATDGGAPEASVGSPGATPPLPPAQNQAPVAEASTWVTVRNLPLTLKFGARDPEGRALTYLIATQPSHGALSKLNLATGQVKYTPGANYLGSDSFTFNVSDDLGARATGTVTIEVVAAPRPVAIAQSVTTVEGAPVTVTLGAPGGSGSPNLAIRTAPTRGTLSALSGAQVTYTPNANANGADSFVFTATDDGVAFTEAVVSISITPVNTAPTVTSPTGLVGYPGVPMMVTLAATDPDSPPNAIAFSASGAINGAVGSVAGNRIAFTPTALGSASFQAMATDGATASAPVTVTIDVRATPRDCSELLRAGFATSANYIVDPDGPETPLDGGVDAAPAEGGASDSGTPGISPLPVVCDMSSDGGGWTLIVNQEVGVPNGGYFASAGDALLRNAGDPSAPLYSIASYLEAFRRHGKFEFRLDWPGLGAAQVWQQSSNPTISATVTGYRGLRIDAVREQWGGLQRSDSPTTLMDGSFVPGNWWYAVGTNQAYSGGIPASQHLSPSVVQRARLWVRTAGFCGNGTREADESCDDGNRVDNDGCNTSCQFENSLPMASCLHVLRSGASQGSGVYVIDPDGLEPLLDAGTDGGPADAGTDASVDAMSSANLRPFPVHCDMARDGGGWTLVGRHAQGDYQNLSVEGYVALLVNPNNDVNPTALLDGTYPAHRTSAWFDRAKTNALYRASLGKVVRMDLTASDCLSANGTFLQKRLVGNADWDFWGAIRDSRRWNRDGSVTGSEVNYFGIDFILSGIPSEFDPTTNSFPHRGDGTFGWWDAYTHSVPGGGTVAVSRHGGLVDDGSHSGCQWIATMNPTDGRFRNDVSFNGRVRVWLR